MKAMLEFSLPEQEREYLQCVYGPKMAILLFRIATWMHEHPRNHTETARQRLTAMTDELDIPWRLVFDAEGFGEGV